MGTNYYRTDTRGTRRHIGKASIGSVGMRFIWAESRDLVEAYCHQNPKCAITGGTDDLTGKQFLRMLKEKVCEHDEDSVGEDFT